MLTNLNVGVLGSVDGWFTILTQEGISFDIISSFDNIDPKKYPVIIIDSYALTKSYKSIENYIYSGGTLLVSTRFWKSCFRGKSNLLKVKYLQPNNLNLFPNIGLVDIYDDIEIPVDNSLDTLDSVLFLFEKNIGSGKLIIYPFNLPKLVNDFRKSRKRFIDRRKELPSEVVSTVSKNKIREIMVSCLRHLFEFKNIPAISLWYYPNNCKTIFIFRIDTDFCSKEKAEKLFNLCIEYDIPATWFLDTSDKSMLKNVYKKMNTQELGLHCDVHRVYNNELLNINNIQNGLNKLKDAGITVNGFAAPFGEWNPSLAKSIKSFKYSSEFSLDYDNYPFHPIINKKKSNVLQIPVHPISIGRLNRSHYSHKEMLDYYINLFDSKMKNNEPIIVYFHPENNHFKVVEGIFQWINNKKITKYSMHNFARWWNKRSAINFGYTYSKKNKRLLSTSDIVKDFYIKITYKNNYSIVKSNETIDLKDIIWEKNKTVSFSRNLSRIRKFYWRDILHNYESKKARKRF